MNAKCEGQLTLWPQLLFCSVMWALLALIRKVPVIGKHNYRKTEFEY